MVSPTLTLQLILATILAASFCCAAQSGNFTYEVSDGNVTITGYPKNATGPVVIPSNIEGYPVTTIGTDAFYQCTLLTSIEIPEGVTSIGYRAFSFVTSLESIKLPDSLVQIGGWAFRACFKLSTIEIPPNVTEIGGEAFDSCPIRLLTIPASLESLGTDAFTANSVLERIDVADENLHFSSVDGVLFDESKDNLILCPPAKSGSFSIPEGVRHIGDRSFISSKLHTITFPEGLISIGKRSFWSCTTGSFHFPASLSEIAPDAFLLSTVVGGFTVDPDNPYFTSLEGSLFNKDRTTLLKYDASSNFTDTYEMPEGVETVGDHALSYSYGLRYVRLPNSLRTIGRFAFQGNRLLRRVNIPYGVTEISYGAFNDCRDLERIDLPDSISNIGDYAFTFCYYLKSVRIPASVVRVGSYSFAGCSGLKSVVFMGSAAELGQSPFQNTGNGFQILHFDSATGIPKPMWNGYPTASLGSYSPKAPWLLSWGIAHDTGLDRDLNGDGVSLLFAYAFGLNPGDRLIDSLPATKLDGSEMKLRYYSAAEGVEYFVEASETLDEWSETGLFFSGIDANGFNTAAVNTAAPARFLRLGIRYAE